MGIFYVSAKQSIMPKIIIHSTTVKTLHKNTGEVSGISRVKHTASGRPEKPPGIEDNRPHINHNIKVSRETLLSIFERISF